VTTTLPDRRGHEGDDAPRASVTVRDRADVLRQVKLVVVLAAATVLAVLFALSVDDPSVFYTLAERATPDARRELNAVVVAWVAAGVLVLVLTAAALDRIPRGWVSGVVFLVAGLAFYAGFLMWYFADQRGTAGLGAITIVNPLPQTVVFATPLVLGALAGVLCERAGVVNIAIEGQFLVGAFFAAVASSLAYSALAGLVGGAVAGVAVGAMLAFFALRFAIDQVVLGVVIIALSLGLTNFLLGQIPSAQANPSLHAYLNEPVTLDPIAIPGLSQIPVLGDALFDQTLLVYLMFASVALVAYLLYRTEWGLRVRAVGEHPKAADTVGIKVSRVRWSAVLLGGVFAGLGGAFFTVGSTGAFDQNPSNGQGFIALAAVIMGRWHPVGATLAATFFGFMLATRDQLGVLAKIDSDVLSAAPYVITVVAVAGFVGRVRPPAAAGQAYEGS